MTNLLPTAANPSHPGGGLNVSATVVLVLLFLLVTVMGFMASRWRRGTNLDSLDEWGLGGRSFGIGSSREQAAVSLSLLGVRAVIARSFARIFWRNAINLGVPCITLEQAGEISAGDRLEVDLAVGRLTNLTTGRGYDFTPLPPHLMAMMDDGGLMPHLKKKLAGAA